MYVEEEDQVKLEVLEVKKVYDMIREHLKSVSDLLYLWKRIWGDIRGTEGTGVLWKTTL